MRASRKSQRKSFFLTVIHALIIFFSSMYAQLLEHITSLGNNTPTAPDTFNEMLKMAREADTLIPMYRKEDYEGVYYWNKDEWTKEFLGGHGVLKVKRVDGAGSALYLVDEDGVVASEAVQQKMRDRLHTLWFTLLKHRRAPISWTKIDILALEFVRLLMRNEFIHFRLYD